MKSTNKIIVTLLILGILLNVSACGRYSEPSPIPGSEYPHSYPKY